MNRLYECHGHIMMDGADFSAARERHRHGVDRTAVESALAALRKAGVGYFRDGGDALGVSVLGRALAPDYGIEYVTPGFAIHKKGYYGAIVGREYETISEFRALVRELKAAGGDFVKIMLSDIITFKAYAHLSCPGLPADEIADLVNIAHGEGLPVMVHVNGEDTVRAAAEAGVDSVEHGYFFHEDLLPLLAEKGIVWVPTLAAAEAFIGRRGIDNAGTAQRTLDEQLRMLRLAREAGVIVAAGSDSGAVGVPHGPGTVREYELLARAGVGGEALRRGNEILREKFSPRRTA